MNKPLLTISLLISNRLDTIPRCLDSLLPIMKAIPCELILIDTSKNSEVHNLLLKYTGQVYEFEWCNDFAKARNEGLSRAKGEWFMFLDDDEWFIESEELINFFKSGEYKDYGYASYVVRNFMDEKHVQFEDVWLLRLVHLQESVKFVGKVHEGFEPLTNNGKNIKALVCHTGYIHDTIEKRNRHFERNHKLLLEMISEEPNNLRWHLQLAQEYVTVEKWQELVVLCEQCLELIGDESTEDICLHIGTLYDGLARGLYAQKKYQDSIKVCNSALADKRVKEIASARMYFRLAENYFYLAEFEQAIVYVEEYLKRSKLDVSQDERLLKQTKAILIGNVFEEKYIKTIYNVLACSYLEENKIHSFAECYEKLGWNEKVIYSIEDVEKYMVKAMWTMDFHPVFLQTIIEVLGNKKLGENFRKEILSKDMNASIEFQKVVYNLEKATQLLIDGPQDGDVIGYHSSLGEYVNALCDFNDFIELQGGVQIENENTLGYFQAAISINEYLQKEKQNTLEALHYLKNAVDALPEIANGVEVFLDSYGALEKQRLALQQKELEALRIQVINQAKTMIEMGQVQEAKQIVEQLRIMFPGDSELEKLME